MSIRLSQALVDALLPRDAGGAPVEFLSGVVRLRSSGFGELRALRRAIDECSTSAAEQIERRAIALLDGILGAAMRRVSVADESRRPTTSARHDEAVERAKAFLAVRIHERPTVLAAARTAEYAPHHLERIFRGKTGLSVHQYLNELRLRQAAVRLDEGAGNRSSLALDLGFSSQSHFTAAFRARFGCPPGAHRLRPASSRRHEDLEPSRVSRRAPAP
jgi:AraC-like DNA-binding protein